MTLLCRSDEVGEGCARGVVIGEGAERRDIVLVRRGGVLRAYANSCPHEGVPLETFPDKFLTADGTLFVCSAHGARFRVEDGVCVSGPCLGKSLIALACDERGGDVLLQVGTVFARSQGSSFANVNVPASNRPIRNA